MPTRTSPSAPAPVRFRVPRSNTTILLTLGFFAVCVITFLLGYSRQGETPLAAWYIAMGLLALVALMGMAFHPRYIELDSDRLILHRTVGTVAMHYDDITAAQIVLLPPGGDVPLFALRGIFGNIGLFYNRNIGRYRAYMASDSESVLVSLKDGRKYLLGCENPAELIKMLEDKLTRK